MAESPLEPLIVDLLWWLSRDERSYEEVMDAWHTTCPRLPVWEDANDLGLVRKEFVHGRCVVRPSEAGMRYLLQRESRSK